MKDMCYQPADAEPTGLDPRTPEKKCVLQYLLLLLLFSSVQKFQIRHHAHGVGDEVGEGLGFEKGCFIIEM